MRVPQHKQKLAKRVWHSTSRVGYVPCLYTNPYIPRIKFHAKMAHFAASFIKDLLDSICQEKLEIDTDKIKRAIAELREKRNIRLERAARISTEIKQLQERVCKLNGKSFKWQCVSRHLITFHLVNSLILLGTICGTRSKYLERAGTSS